MDEEEDRRGSEGQASARPEARSLEVVVVDANEGSADLWRRLRLQGLGIS